MLIWSENVLGRKADSDDQRIALEPAGIEDPIDMIDAADMPIATNWLWVLTGVCGSTANRETWLRG